jgi:hypothetical protein
MSRSISVRIMAMAGLAVVQTLAVQSAQGQQDRFLPASVVNARLDSLERVVRTASIADTGRAAITKIASVGWFLSEQLTPLDKPRYPGVVARLAKIYRQSEADDYWTRYSIIRLLSFQVERREAVALLEQIAQEPYEEPVPPPGVAFVNDYQFSLQDVAINTLTLTGPEGEASLKRLHAGGKVREPVARARLEHLARRGFRKDGG